MSHTLTESSDTPAQPPPPNAPSDGEAASPEEQASSDVMDELASREVGVDRATERVEPRNFVVLVAYQVLMRTGWIFKTESIIMPYVLDTLGASAWVRGLLPLFNRFGQSVPPLLVARRVKVVPQKKWLLMLFTSLMAASFFALALIWAVTGGSHWWMQPIFLAVYVLFFASTGINNLVWNTLQGKLIEATHRGRLMLTANLIGAVSAIGCVLLLLPRWLNDQQEYFVPIFGFTGLCFALSAVSVLFLVERRDAYQQPASGLGQLFATAWQTLRADANFRRLAVVAAAFSTSTMLFPHYQALGRGGELALPVSQLLWWVVLQNAGTAMFSFIAGPLADARGNRMVLRLIMLGVGAAPLAALAMAHWGQGVSTAFSLVFVLVGVTPIGIRIFNHYTLEVAEPADHPRYLSTLSLCMAAPILGSPLVGLCVDLVGFDVVFLAITAILFIGWLVSFGLREPRLDALQSGDATSK